MTGKPALNNTSESRDARRPSAPVEADAPARPDPAALVQGLERLRDGLARRLAQVEALALEQTRRLEQNVSEREQTLSDRVCVLEAAQARLQAESKRREQECQALLQQLDDDRRLLAESWERLEDEQLDAPAPAPAAPAAGRPPAPRPEANDPADGAVTRAILQEFQALKSDVRRNAKERNGR